MVLALFCQKLPSKGVKRLCQAFQPTNRARPHQRKMFPKPRLTLLIGLKRRPACRHGAFIARRAQAHIELIEPPLRHRSCYGSHQGLREPRIIGPCRKRAAALRHFHILRIVNHNNIKVRRTCEASRAKRAHSNHGCPFSGRRTMFCRKLRHDFGP